MQRKIAGGLGVTGALSAIGLVLYSVWGAGGLGSDQPTASPGEAHASVSSLLRNRRQAWHLRAQKSADRKLVEGFKSPKMRAALLEILRKPKHQMMLEAVHAAGVAGLEEGISYLRARWKAGPLPLRVVAFTALDRIRPWDAGELFYQLTGEDEAGVRGALLVAGRRPALPAVVIVAVLGHSNPEIAKLALSAIPRPLDSEACEELMERLDAESSRSLAIVALKRCRIKGALERCLTAWVDRAPHLRRIILNALARKISRLTNPKPVLALASGSSAGSSVDQILAMQCLVKTRTPFSSSELKHGLESRATAVRYHAARLLLSRGDRAGLGVLLGLLDVNDWKDDDIDDDALYMTYRECCDLTASIFGVTPREILADLEKYKARIPSIAFDPPPPTGIDLHGG